MRYKGFTLAEVLITLGVIGVVAAMTLPTLIQEHREKARVTQVKKAYSILSQAFTMAVQEYGDIEDWELTTTSTGKTDEDGNAVYETSGQILLRNRLAQYVKQLDKPNWNLGLLKLLMEDILNPTHTQVLILILVSF